MSIFAAQPYIVPGQPEQNLQSMLELIQQGRERHAQLVVFPELSVSGPLLGDLAESEAFLAQCGRARFRIAEASQDLAVLFGCPWQDAEGKLRNGVWLAQNGELRPVVPAMAAPFLAHGYDGFAPEPKMEPFYLELDGKEQSFGVLLGDWALADPPENIGKPDWLLDLSLRPVCLNRDMTPPLALDGRYLAVNGSGLVNSGSTCYLLAGNSRRYDSGSLVGAASYFTPGLYDLTNLPALPEDDILLREALVEGVRAFMKQIRSSKAVIGVSGGIDSALAACVYTQALGPENVYLISMPSKFNSSRTKGLAVDLAEALDCPFAVMPIEKDVNSLLDAFGSTTFRSTHGESRLTINDLGHENVMARDRGRILAAAAAAVGGVFTCNGNKAELTVGYATFYGDLAGAFAAQADMWKYQIYQASSAFEAVFPGAPLDRIAAIRPSAELSLAQSVDKGLGDPLQYDYHDFLLRYWVEQNGGLAQCLTAYRSGELEELLGCNAGLAKKYFPEEAQFIADLEYWWKQYRGMGVAKRIQAPPLLALSSRPFGEALPQSQTPVWFDEAYLRAKEQPHHGK